MPNKYTALTEKAIAYSKAFYSHRDQCRNLLRPLALGFQRYLDAPDGQVVFVPLTEELKSGKDEIPISSLPDLVRGNDGWWYIGLRIHFRNGTSAAFGQVTLKLGIKWVRDKLHVHFEKNFEIDPNNSESYEPVFDYIYNGLTEDYLKPADEPTTRIGF